MPHHSLENPMANPRDRAEKGYQPSPSERGYQPRPEPGSEPTPHSGYQPTNEQSNPSSVPNPPGDE